MKRCFDFFIGILFLLIFLLPMVFIAILVRMTSRGPALYWSERVGRGNIVFRMPKFRSMKTNTKQVATHLMENPKTHLTPIGGFLRKSSLDELPQLFSVLSGDLSFVGPRPALFNQKDLIELRSERGIDRLIPGITGWAQINGRDDLTIPEKVAFDEEYLNRRSFFFDLKILLKTTVIVVLGREVSH